MTNSEISRAVAPLDLPTTSPVGRLQVAIVGHVDHGKSTLVGRLLNDTGSLPDGKIEAVRQMSERRGMPFEWAFVMDALIESAGATYIIETTTFMVINNLCPFGVLRREDFGERR